MNYGPYDYKLGKIDFWSQEKIQRDYNIIMQKATTEWLNWKPNFTRTVNADNQTVIKVVLPGFDVSELKLVQQENTVVLSSAITDWNNKMAETMDFVLEFFMVPESIFLDAELVNGILRMVFDMKDPKKSKKELRINIPSPSSSAHPRLLNEDSDF